MKLARLNPKLPEGSMNFPEENGFFAGLRFPQLAGSEFSMCQLKNVRETVNWH